MDRQPDRVAAAFVEIGVRGEKRLGLPSRRVAKTVDIMMAIALGVGDADQGTEREILLHTKSGLTGQVLAGDKKRFASAAPFSGAGRVDDGLVETFAGFRRDAAVAERARRRKCVVAIVGFVDDEIARREL